MLSTGAVGKPGDSAPQCGSRASRGGRWGPGRPGRDLSTPDPPRDVPRLAFGPALVRRPFGPACVSPPAPLLLLDGRIRCAGSTAHPYEARVLTSAGSAPSPASSARTASVSAPSGRPAWRIRPGVARQPGDQALHPARRRRRRCCPRAADVLVGEHVGHRVRPARSRRARRRRRPARRPSHGRRSTTTTTASSSSRCSDRPANDAKRGSSADAEQPSTRAATLSADVESATHTPSRHR